MQDAMLIAAAKESGLWAEYESHPKLLWCYMRKLLQWGWAGEKTPTECEYIKLARRALGKGRSPAQEAAFSKARKCSQDKA